MEHQRALLPLLRSSRKRRHSSFAHGRSRPWCDFSNSPHATIMRAENKSSGSFPARTQEIPRASACASWRTPSSSGAIASAGRTLRTMDWIVARAISTCASSRSLPRPPRSVSQASASAGSASASDTNPSAATGVVLRRSRRISSSIVLTDTPTVATILT